MISSRWMVFFFLILKLAGLVIWNHVRHCIKERMPGRILILRLRRKVAKMSTILTSRSLG